MSNVYMVSVVRDYQMYGKCVKDNLWCKDLNLLPLDNLKENKPITVRYNEFLDSFTEEGWIVFCHEDWMLECDIRPILETLDKSMLWGPIGVYLEECQHSDFVHLYGRVNHSMKDGRGKTAVVGLEDSARVDCFDCQCLIVHSSLIKQYGLRFDPNLKFDMYVEDFCVNAYEKHDIISHTVRIECTHYSKGDINTRFHNSLDYVREKYKDSKKRYITIVGRHNGFGRNSDKPIHTYRNSLIPMIRYYLLK